MSAATERRATGSVRSRLRRRRSPAPLLLGVFALAAGLWMTYEARAITFWSDDWAFIVDRRDWSADALLSPHNGHLVAVHALVYKLLFATVGTSSIWPYKALVIGLHLLVVALVYRYAERRVGPVLGALAAGLMVIFGSAAEVIAWQFHAGNLIALSAGLGALLCLDRRRDGASAALLAVSLASSSFGVPFLLGAAVEVGAGADRRRRAWVPLVPAALYVLWRVLSGADSTRAPLDLWGGYIEGGLARSVGALLGLPIEWGVPLTIVLAFLLARAVLRPGPAPGQLWRALAMLLGYWLLLAFARSALGDAGNERYLYPGALFVLLLVLELGRGAVVPARAWPLIAIAAVLITLTNIGNYTGQLTTLIQRSHQVAVAVTALQVAGAKADPAYQPNIMDYGKTAGEVQAALADLGSPYDAPDVIRDRPVQYTPLADATLRGAEHVALQPAAGAGACRALTPGADGTAQIELPPEGLVLRAKARAAVALSRYQPGTTGTIGRLEPRRPARLAAPADGDPATPWRVRVTPAAGVSACAPSG